MTKEEPAPSPRKPRVEDPGRQFIANAKKPAKRA